MIFTRRGLPNKFLRVKIDVNKNAHHTQRKYYVGFMRMIEKEYYGNIKRNKMQLTIKLLGKLSNLFFQIEIRVS